MREIRMYGSEGGVVQTNVLSLPLSEEQRKGIVGLKPNLVK